MRKLARGDAFTTAAPLWAAYLAAALIVVTPLGAAPAGGATAPADGQTRIILGYLPSNAFLAAFVAKDQGFFAGHGLNVSFDMLPSGPMLRRALADGRVQAGTLTAPALLRQDDAGADLQAVAGASMQSRDHSTAGIVAAAHSNVHGAADFRGKTVGVPGLNGVNHLAFMKWLQDHRVDPTQVRFAAVTLPQMADQLKAGRIDAALPVEPFLDAIVHSGAGVLVAKFPGETGDSFLVGLYAMQRSWVKSNPAAVGAFRDSLRDGVRWIAANPAAARKIQMRYLKVSEAAALSVPLPEYTTDVSAAEIQFWIELCRRFGATQTSLPAAQVLAD